jgi:hypothetical protein
LTCINFSNRWRENNFHSVGATITAVIGENAMRDAGISFTSSVLRTKIVTGLAIGAFVAATTLVGVPRDAQALPAYAAKEGKACGYCHANPAGGGPRNARGQKYEANGHKFK